VVKLRTPKKGRAGSALIASAAAVGITATLVLGHATDTMAEHLTVRLSNTVIAAGGLGDPTSIQVKNKLAATVVPAGYGYEPINYPASINLAGSRDIGIPRMRMALVNHGGEQLLIVAGYSEGTLIAEQVRRDLQATAEVDAPAPDQLTFVMVASPFAGNGGILGRFPWLDIPGVIDPMGAAQPTRYDTTYYAYEYDTYADFPAYFNPVALVNSLFAVRYAHPDPYYDPIDPATAPKVQKTVPNVAGGTDTYVLFLNPHLPLFGPIREISTLLALTPLTEPVLGAIEPLVRLAVDAGYSDRTYANPETPTTFSLITPPAKFVEAIAGVPGALAQGASNLLSGGQSATTTQTRSVTAPDAPQSQALEGRRRLALAPVVVPKIDGKRHEADDAQRITHPTVTSDGNKVTPTTTAIGTAKADPRAVDPVPVGTTNSVDSQSVPVPPTAPSSPATPSSATDTTSHQATDDAAA
jgi:diacyltrehalose acyltransferase